MCCGLPDVPGLTLKPAAGAGTPALIQFGTADPVIAVARAIAGATALSEAGWNVRQIGYDMGHSQTIEMMLDARDFLASIP
jgi:predicted esterase